MIISQKQQWQCYRDGADLTNDGAIKNVYVGDNNIASFKFKQKITGKTYASTKDVEIIVPLKFFSNFWRTLEMPLINCEVNLILTWSEKCMLSNDIKDNSTQDNEQIRSAFKRTINWNKY